MHHMAAMKVVPKVWGSEQWIVNTSRYCGKLMTLKKGWQCSLHMHKEKDETFFIESGKVLFEYQEPGKSRRKKVLKPGAVVRVLPGTWHRFGGLTNARFFEFSTTHRESDSYRKEMSSRMSSTK